MTSSIPRAVFKAIVGMLVRKGRTKRGGGGMVRDQVSAISYFSSNLFFHDFNFPVRLQLSYSTSTLFHDLNFPAQLTFFSRIQLSCTTSTILHDFNFLARLQHFSRLQLFFTTQHFNFPARLKYSAVLVDWTPPRFGPSGPNPLADMEPPPPPVQIR